MTGIKKPTVGAGSSAAEVNPADAAAKGAEATSKTEAERSAPRLRQKDLNILGRLGDAIDDEALAHFAAKSALGKSTASARALEILQRDMPDLAARTGELLKDPPAAEQLGRTGDRLKAVLEAVRALEKGGRSEDSPDKSAAILGAVDRLQAAIDAAGDLPVLRQFPKTLLERLGVELVTAGVKRGSAPAPKSPAGDIPEPARLDELRSLLGEADRAIISRMGRGGVSDEEFARLVKARDAMPSLLSVLGLLPKDLERLARSKPDDSSDRAFVHCALLKDLVRAQAALGTLGQDTPGVTPALVAEIAGILAAVEGRAVALMGEEIKSSAQVPLKPLEVNPALAAVAAFSEQVQRARQLHLGLIDAAWALAAGRPVPKEMRAVFAATPALRDRAEEAGRDQAVMREVRSIVTNLGYDIQDLESRLPTDLSAMHMRLEEVRTKSGKDKPRLEPVAFNLDSLEKALEEVSKSTRVAGLDPDVALKPVRAFLASASTTFERLGGKRMSTQAWKPASYQPKVLALESLPESRIPSAESLASPQAAAKLVAERLGEDKLAEALAKVAAGGPPELAQEVLAGLALLADEVAHAPDYMRAPGLRGENRAHYRARKHGAEKAVDVDSQTAAKRALADDLLRAARGGLAPLGDVLAKHFLAGAYLPAPLAEDWLREARQKGLPVERLVHEALRGEAYLPLRALNAHAALGGTHFDAARPPPDLAVPLMRQLTRAVFEGRFEAWRLELPTSVAQLEHLSPAQRQAWLADDHSVTLSVKGDDGKPVEVKTREAHGFERFWSTRVGGPSHGMDSGLCIVGLLTNARNDTVVVEDPRWRNDAARTYTRLLQLEDTGAPVMLLEGPHTDFELPYGAGREQYFTALIKHAVQKARKLGVQLCLSSELGQLIAKLQLPGQYKDPTYRLAPSALLENASIFGPHDWLQPKVEARKMRAPQFFVDLDKVGELGGQP